MNTSSGKFLLVESERSCAKNSAYMNKFGETYSEQSRRWDNFYLDDQAYEELRKMYMSFKVCNDVLTARSVSDYVLRTRAV